MDESLEWLELMDRGAKRAMLRHVLELAQAVGALFAPDAWSEKQRSLIERLER